MTSRRLTFALLTLTLIVLFVSAPAALRDDLARGQIYVFTRDFVADIPRRLAGPGRFRFILQPALASILGVRDGVRDARAGRHPYLLALLTGKGDRHELLKSAMAAIVNILLMGILLDAVFQRVILGVTHPGAALVIGPVLICAPYAVVRALANRGFRILRPD